MRILHTQMDDCDKRLGRGRKMGKRCIAEMKGLQGASSRATSHGTPSSAGHATIHPVPDCEPPKISQCGRWICSLNGSRNQARLAVSMFRQKPSLGLV